jgi:predicted helicase
MDLIMDSEPGRYGDLEGFLRGLSRRPLPREDVRDYLVHYVLMEELLDGLFAGYPFLERDGCRRATRAFLSGLRGFDGHRETYAGLRARFLPRIGARPDGAARQGLICQAIQEVYNAAYREKARQHGVVFTPVEVVDFIVISATRAAREMAEGTGREIEYLDPFAGTGIFAARVIQLGMLDADPLGKYGALLKCYERDVFFWHVMRLNVEETFWSHTGGKYGHQPFAGARLTDTFLEYPNGAE